MKNNKVSYFSSIIKGAVILSVLIIIAGCSKNIQHETLEDMVANAKSKVNIISVEDYKAISEHDGNYEIIDCRQADDFIKGHIPGAINIQRGILEFSDKISNRRTKIFIYDYSDDCSALCAETLLKLKYHDVTMIENGWKGWSKTYPEIFETGAGTSDTEAPPKKEESGGGCGG
jgi:rhodanese-related sulfurtransferase